MVKKDEILYEWSVPQRFIRREANRLLKRGKKITPFFIIITIILLAFTYFMVKDYVPDSNRSWESKFLLTSAVLFGIILYVYLIGPWLMRNWKSTYQITDKGIISKGEQNRHLWRWEKIKGYRIDQDKEANSSVLTLILDTYQRKCYLADEEESIDRVNNFIAEKVPYIEKEELESPKEDIITKRDYIILTILTLVYIICYTWFLLSYRPKGNLGTVFLALPFFLGPGTLGCFALFGKRMYKSPKLYKTVVILNMLAFILIILSLTIILFIKYYREANA